MNQQQAESVKDLAKLTVKALERIVERECRVCSDTGKVKWKWEPEVGEFCLWICGAYPDSMELVVEVTEINGGKYVRFVDKNKWEEAEGFTPILPWEEIERVLEECNHRTYTSISDSGNALCQICFRGRRKGRHNVMAKANGKSRQEAVMLATIELDKEKK